ncbi:hypothetical protein ATG98_3903 [Marinobacter sp. LV10R520-4]|jgi:hypothetical protein|uniref:hypothetical protein n=1 Tax=Marinobacter sp. LV10R520-4 TaxID=1761796 RepID=UPI000BF56718|nr:hypothetical protein [Marinobacter sp. LV10R520-4]PFG54624.1 hypothetical protein ATG98_3903 [Marinobacter sp. LV10R520-4]
MVISNVTKKILNGFLLFSVLLVSPISAAEENFSKHTIYAGVGPAPDGDEKENDDKPWSLGYLYSPESIRIFVGMDLALEGTSLDNTSRKVDSVDQGFSVNLVIGPRFRLNDEWGAGVGALMGARESGRSCPDSYLGYQCYADEKPEMDFKFNYGALLLLTYKNAIIGTRLAVESSQLIVGVTF